MNLYENQRSKSFIDLCPRSLRFNILNFFSLKKIKQQASWSQIPYWASMGYWDENSFKCSGSQDQDGKKKHSKNFWTKRQMMKVGIQHWYSSTTRFVQMMTLGWPGPFLWHGQISFLMLLHGWKLIQHIIMYFQGCSNSSYLMLSGEQYRTI